jgi:hypothetical protein
MEVVLVLALWCAANLGFVVFMNRRSRVRSESTGQQRASARTALGL